MRLTVGRLGLAIAAVAVIAAAQTSSQTEGPQAPSDDDFHVYSDAPRLLLTKNRLRLLQRERERLSMRWTQFDSLITGGAAMPEPGFAYGLYYRVASDRAAGRKAVEWALSSAATDLRQLALVFDWCGPVMSPSETDRLGTKIERAMAGSNGDVRRESARALAAIAIADRLRDHGDAALRSVAEKWWRGTFVTHLAALPREQIYWLFEMMHAVRDNLKIELRDTAVPFFKALPIDHLASHYPAPFEAAENEYRVPVYTRDGEPDREEAALSRAAELEMVAYDTNALESQYLQGWLMQDRFLMRGALGAVYEFLWANPYQPGLSYFQAPLVYHDAQLGHVFARTSWDEDATWIGYFNGHLQVFQDGRIQSLKPGATFKPVKIGGSVLLGVKDRRSAQFNVEGDAMFVLGLEPRSHYDVEVDDQELWDAETDAGGTLVLSFPAGLDAGVRIKLRPPEAH
jgi:hypothetical protein